LTYKSHAELEQYHYRAVRDNPRYTQEGLAEILHEELMACLSPQDALQAKTSTGNGQTGTETPPIFYDEFLRLSARVRELEWAMKKQSDPLKTGGKI
jgi:hypothetical protein